MSHALPTHHAITLGTSPIVPLTLPTVAHALHIETNVAVEGRRGPGVTTLTLRPGTAPVPPCALRVTRSGVGDAGAALDPAYGFSTILSMLPTLRKKVRELAEHANETGATVFVSASVPGGTGAGGNNTLMETVREVVPPGRLVVLHAPYYVEGAKAVMRLLDRIVEVPTSAGEFHVVDRTPEEAVALAALPPDVFRQTMGVAVNLETEDAPTVGARFVLHMVRAVALEPLALAGEAAREAYTGTLDRWSKGFGDADASAPRVGDLVRRAVDRAGAAATVPDCLLQKALSEGERGASELMAWVEQTYAGSEVHELIDQAMRDLARAGLTKGLPAASSSLERIGTHLDALEVTLGGTTLTALLRAYDEIEGLFKRKELNAAAKSVQAYTESVLRHRLGRAVWSAFEEAKRYVEDLPAATEIVLLDDGMVQTLVQERGRALLHERSPFTAAGEAAAQRAAERAALESMDRLVLAAVARDARPGGALDLPWRLEPHVEASKAHGVIVTGPVSHETAEAIRAMLGAERFEFHPRESGPVHVVRLAMLDKLTDSRAFASFVSSAERDAQSTPDKGSRAAGDLFPVRIRPGRATDEEAVMALLLAALMPGVLRTEDGVATVDWPGAARERLDSLDAVRDALRLDVEARLHRQFWNERFAADPLGTRRHLDRLSKLASGAKATADNERWERLASVCGVQRLEAARQTLAERMRVVQSYLRSPSR